MIYLNVWFLLLGCFKLIKDYLYIKNNNEIIYENKLIGLEVEKLKNNEYYKIDTLLYSPDTDIQYNNIEYIGNNTNLIKIYLFYKDDDFFYNRIINIVKSYKYSQSILNTINNLDEKIMLNEISINKVFIYDGKYSNNINDIALYYSKNNIRLVILLGFIYFTKYFIEYFSPTYFWTQFNII